MAKSASADDILAVARDADAVLVTYAKLPGRAVAPTHSLQGDRPLPCLGVDNIDLPAAKELGIAAHNYVPELLPGADGVGSCPHVSSRAGGATARRFPTGSCNPAAERGGAHRSAAAASKGKCWPRRLRQHPRALAPKAKALGLKVPPTTLTLQAVHLPRPGVEGVSFGRFIGRSDLFRCMRHCCRQNAWPDERSPTPLPKMKRAAFLINTARGAAH